MAFIPEDLTIEILQCVESIKSIGRFRCVSKAWRSLLSTPQFLKSHLEKFHIHSPPKLFFLSSPPYIRTFTTKSGSCNHTVTNKKVIMFPDFDLNLHWLVQGSCHGLVLFGGFQHNKDANLVLLNPITENNERIPPIPDYDSYEYDCGYGLGYDSCTDDYKIVSIRKHVLHIYSVKTKTWRILQNSSDYQYQSQYQRRVFANGRLYFLSGEGLFSAIAAFNLGTEKFESVPYPKGFNHEMIEYYRLLDLGGCLTIWDYFSHYVWLMKDCGLQDFWMKFAIGSYIDVPLWVLGCEDEIVVYKWGECKFSAYNLKSGVSNKIVVSGTSDNHLLDPYGIVIGFRESLISPTYC